MLTGVITMLHLAKGLVNQRNYTHVCHFHEKWDSLPPFVIVLQCLPYFFMSVCDAK